MDNFQQSQQEEGGGRRRFVVSKQWNDQEDGRLVLNCLQYLDVVTLVKKKPVCKQWQDLCTKAIDNKCHEKKSFQSNQELGMAVDKYSPGYDGNNTSCTPRDGEEIASTYGYPINKWDVSNVTDFSWIFNDNLYFNEPIGSWDVSNATTMIGMFDGALSFNQDISSWDVSNVTIMLDMFFHAGSFNQDVSSWDVSKVTDMDGMFSKASSFNQDISAWDVSSVSNMDWMFHGAKSFDQDLSSWNVSNVTTIIIVYLIQNNYLGSLKI